MADSLRAAAGRPADGAGEDGFTGAFFFGIGDDGAAPRGAVLLRVARAAAAEVLPPPLPSEALGAADTDARVAANR